MDPDLSQALQILDRDGIDSHVRLAGPQDMLPIWNLSNDPQVRANSFTPRPIPLETHKEWFRRKMESLDTCIYVLDVAGALLGQVRFAKVDDCAEVDLAVSPAVRGRGVGRRLLETTCDAAAKRLGVSTIKAIVKSDNAASLKCCLASGFRVVATREINGVHCEVLEKSSEC